MVLYLWKNKRRATSSLLTLLCVVHSNISASNNSRKDVTLLFRVCSLQKKTDKKLSLTFTLHVYCNITSIDILLYAAFQLKNRFTDFNVNSGSQKKLCTFESLPEVLSWWHDALAQDLTLHTPAWPDTLLSSEGNRSLHVKLQCPAHPFEKAFLFSIWFLWLWLKNKLLGKIVQDFVLCWWGPSRSPTHSSSLILSWSK